MQSVSCFFYVILPFSGDSKRQRSSLFLQVAQKCRESRTVHRHSLFGGSQIVAKRLLKRTNEAVNLEANKPTFFWSHAECGEWIADHIRHSIVSETRIVFDYPSRTWAGPRHAQLVDMRLGSDGHYHWHTPKDHYCGVKTETGTHVVLNGTWLSLGERGNFVAVFPKHSPE
jgi:hypothetical protein